MIVPMKKIALIALSSQAQETVEQLQQLGVLHVQQLHHHDLSEHAIIARMHERIEDIKTCIYYLEDLKSEKIEGSEVAKKLTVDEMIERIERIDHIDLENQNIGKVLDDFEPFGDFDPEHIQRLAEKGVHVRLYRSNRGALPAIPEHAAMATLKEIGDELYYAVVSDRPFQLDLPAMSLPEKPTTELKDALQGLKDERQAIRRELAAQARFIPDLRDELLGVHDELALEETRERLGKHGELSWVMGYCLDKRLSAVEEAAKTHGWGLRITDPGKNDEVPTLIENPAWLRPVETVFNFIETYPGYHERDASPAFYFFLSLFYAMLIGDVGYGMIFLAICAGVHFRFGDRIPKQPLILFYVFNVATVIWGVLTGSWFGIRLSPDNPLMKLAVIDTDNTQLMMIICFVIGAIQLSIAHLWNMVCMINSKKAIAEIGWLMALWTAFFLAMNVIAGVDYPSFMTWVGLAGIAMALVFSGDLTNVAGMFQFPFKVIGCFADIASYLRLFAVGSAAVALARVFNGMALEMGWDGVLASFGSAVILLVGHSLNLVLGPLSVLVHGLRLNLLEFSGHMGQEWTGFKYDPFRCHRTTNDQTR